MNIALVTHKFAKGDGQGRVNYEIARAALAAGHTVWLVASEIDPVLARHPRARVVRLGVKPWPTALLKNQIFGLRTTLWLVRHRRSLDVVHANGFVSWARSDINTAHFVHAAWLRSVHNTHRTRKDWRGWYQGLYTWCGTFLEAWAYRNASLVVPVSRQVEAELAAAGVDRGRLRVVPNGVDLAEFRQGARLREPLGLPEGVLLLFVGDIKTPRKNLDTLLRALTLTPGCTLLVVGETAGSSYPALAMRLGLESRVRFLGYRRDVAELMGAADVFVFPSRYEACSLVLLEAAASGLPVVVARSTGGAELLDEQCSVFLTDADDAHELAAALHALVSSPSMRARMGAAARRTAERFSWDAMASQYLSLYQECAAAPARAGMTARRLEAR